MTIYDKYNEELDSSEKDNANYIDKIRKTGLSTEEEDDIAEAKFIIKSVFAGALFSSIVYTLLK